jgi:hypothetical protein
MQPFEQTKKQKKSKFGQTMGETVRSMKPRKIKNIKEPHTEPSIPFEETEKTQKT